MKVFLPILQKCKSWDNTYGYIYIYIWPTCKSLCSLPSPTTTVLKYPVSE